MMLMQIQRVLRIPPTTGWLLEEGRARRTQSRFTDVVGRQFCNPCHVVIEDPAKL